MDTKPAPQQQQLKNQRSEDFFTGYANNFLLETTVWDMKIIFGQLDQAAGIIEQHTAITVPWSVVKLAIYHLRAALAAYEIIYGKIALSPDILPPEPPPPTDEQKANPLFQRAYEQIKNIREEFLKAI